MAYQYESASRWLFLLWRWRSRCCRHQLKGRELTSTIWRRRLWQCFYQLEGGAMRCQHEGGGYGFVATNLKWEVMAPSLPTWRKRTMLSLMLTWRGGGHLEQRGSSTIIIKSKEGTYVTIAPNLNEFQESTTFLWQFNVCLNNINVCSTTWQSATLMICGSWTLKT